MQDRICKNCNKPFKVTRKDKVFCKRLCKDYFHKKQNPETHKQYRQKHYIKHKDKILIDRKEYYSKNRDKILKYLNDYYYKNFEYYQKARSKHYQDNIEYNREYKRKYRKENPEVHRTANAKRKAALLQAIPKFADLNKIKEIYKNCPIGYEVDHIIPLQGKIVSGLHVETNLQYLPIKENRSKGNKLLDYIA